MHPLIEHQRQNLRALAGSYGMRSIKVFGSMARSDAGPESDIDLLGRPVDIVTLAALHPAIRDKVLREAQEL